MNLFKKLRTWYASCKQAGEVDRQQYEEELQAEAREFLSETAWKLRGETERIQQLLRSDMYTLGIPSQFASEGDSPWLDPRFRIERNNEALAAWNRLSTNQRIFTERAGEHLVADFYTAYGGFTNALDELGRRESERARKTEE